MSLSFVYNLENLEGFGAALLQRDLVRQKSGPLFASHTKKPDGQRMVASSGTYGRATILPDSLISGGHNFFLAKVAPIPFPSYFDYLKFRVHPSYSIPRPHTYGQDSLSIHSPEMDYYVPGSVSVFDIPAMAPHYGSLSTDRQYF